MNQNTPTIGERVRVVSAYDESGEEYIGKEGKVVAACAPEYEVLLDGLGGGYTFYDGELEVLTQEVTGL